MSIVVFNILSAIAMEKKPAGGNTPYQKHFVKKTLPELPVASYFKNNFV